MRKTINIAILFIASLFVGCDNKPIPQLEEVFIQTGGQLESDLKAIKSPQKSLFFVLIQIIERIFGI